MNMSDKLTSLLMTLSKNTSIPHYFLSQLKVCTILFILIYSITVWNVDIHNIEQKVWGQENNNGTQISDSNLTSQRETGLSLVPTDFIIPAITGVVGVAGSLLTVIVTNRHNFQRDRIQRDVNTLQDKLNIYSFFIFSLEKMIYAGFKEYASLASDIDSTIKSKFYLLQPDFITMWAEIRGDIHIYSIEEKPKHGGYGAESISDRAFFALLLNIYKLRDRLVSEYNNVIIEQHKTFLVQLRGGEHEIINRVHQKTLEVKILSISLNASKYIYRN